MTEEIVKKVVEKADPRIMRNTLKELDDLDIQALQIVAMGDMNLKLTNEQFIKLVNYNAKRAVLTWDNTLKEAFDLGIPFLI